MSAGSPASLRVEQKSQSRQGGSRHLGPACGGGWRCVLTVCSEERWTPAYACVPLLTKTCSLGMDAALEYHRVTEA